MANGSTPVARVDSLTSLRFFLSIVVAMAHATTYVTSLTFIYPHLLLANLCLPFFFMLSGFALTWTWQEGDTARGFWWRRFVRIWPMHLVACAAALLLLPLWTTTRFDGAHIAAVLLLVQGWFHSPDWQFAVNGPAWSLSAEVLFYALFPVLILLTRHRHVVQLVVATSYFVALPVCVSLLGGVSLYTQYVAPYLRLGECMVGMLMAVAIRRGWRSPVSLNVALGLFLALYVVGNHILVGLVGTEHGYQTAALAYNPILRVIYLGPMVLVLLAAATASLEGRPTFLSRPAFVRLGDWSLGFYLFHIPLIMILSRHTVGWDWPSALIAVIATLAGAMTLAGMANEWIERPLELRLRPLVPRRSRSRTPVAQRRDTVPVAPRTETVPALVSSR